MIDFKDQEGMQIVNVIVDDVINWAEMKLKEIFGLEFTVWCNPSPSRNSLSFNIDETVMDEDQWLIFSEKFNTSDGYSDNNFVWLLNYTYGKARYIFHVEELNSFYIIRDTLKR